MKRLSTNTASSIGLSLFTVTLALAQPAYAQATGQNSVDTSAPAAKHWHHRHHDRLPVEQRLNGLKSALQIQPNQEGAWRAYASAVEKAQANRKTLWQERKQSSQTLTLPERIDRREAAFEQMHADRQSVNDALKQLYGSLTTQQQAVLEKHFARHHKGAGQV